MKRTHEDTTNSISKKPKTDFNFPLGIKAVTQEISKYLEGDYLKNFKLACKTFNEITKGQSCAIEINAINFERTTSTPGYHIIKLNDPEFRKYLRSDRLLDRKVKKLITDCCGIESTIDIQYITLLTFKNLKSLRIIRSIGDVRLIISNSYLLNSLEVYTTGCITLTLYKKLEKVLLCSTDETLDEAFANIIIHMPLELFVPYTPGIKCCAKRHEIQYTNRNNDYIVKSINTFVPKPEYLA